MANDHIETIAVSSKSFLEYRELDDDVYRQATEAAKVLAGKRIVHINSTEKGGGVAELLKSQVALENDLGINSQWLVIRPRPRFFDVTKNIHNLLQGKPGRLTEEDIAIYESESVILSHSLANYFQSAPVDLIITHDPQPLLAVVMGAVGVPKALRLHIDTCQPNEATIRWLCKLASDFNHVVVSLLPCAPSCLTVENVSGILPAIDPFAPKNVPLTMEHANEVLRVFGVDPARPLITQVSRLEPWKRPIEVVAAYKRVKEKIPSVQLVLAGFIAADDDPEALTYVKEVQKLVDSDPDIHIFSDIEDLRARRIDNDTFINALQVTSKLIVQFSLREGFGLTVTEAMWKAKPVVAGDVGGIKLQIKDRENGRLVQNVNELVGAIIELLDDPQLGKRLGVAAHQSVKQSFLMPRYLLQHFELYQKLLQ